MSDKAAKSPRQRHAVDCPECNGADTRCKRTTKKNGIVTRQRICAGCGLKFVSDEGARKKKSGGINSSLGGIVASLQLLIKDTPLPPPPR